MKMQAQHKGGPRKPDVSYNHTPNKETEQLELIDIAAEMIGAKLPPIFIINALKTSLDFEGVADLMKLWKEETDQTEKEEIIADIQDILDSCLQKNRTEEFYIKFNDLKTIAKNIRLFKDSLLSVVEINGGLKHLSELTGIPQPSLSRFFNSSSMPQRTTLIKIAKALDIDELKMDSFWEDSKNRQN